MKERGIQFTGPNVRAILNGAKTQTRRMVKPQPSENTTLYLNNLEREADRWWPCSGDDDYTGVGVRCPHGVPGDRLWVRETWRTFAGYDDVPPRDIPRGAEISFLEQEHWTGTEKLGKVRPGMFLPRRFSRITLEISDVRVERLQAISDEDCIAEGIFKWPLGFGLRANLVGHKTRTFDSPVTAYAFLWNSLNEKSGHGWLENPFVWVITFRRLT